MSEILIIAFLFLVMLGSMAFYFYSRMLYSERKISLLESILLDIKLHMEMEHESRHDHLPAMLPPKMNANNIEELKDETEYYNSVLENTHINTPEFNKVNELIEPTVADKPADVKVESEPQPVDYESMNRDDLASLADKRGIRVGKRQAKSNIIILLREADKNSSSSSETGKDEPVGASTGIPSMEGTSGGASLEMGGVEELPL